MIKRLSTLTAAAALFFTSSAHAATANPADTLSAQNVLTGATAAVRASANNGAGVEIGMIDTGIAASWIGFTAGQVDTKNSTCVVAGCGKTLAITDNNGHGSFTASEIGANLSQYGMTGVAPAAKLLSVKVLHADGTGTSTDLSNGILYAANKGAEVLSMSVGPTGTPAQQAAFYASLAPAINYAASKNAVIVFAGGNSAQMLAGAQQITGFTDAAISRMIFMGSTGATQALSSFSNTPGTGGFVSTTGKFTSFQSLWMMADGENIWGASTYHDATGYDYVTQMSGTSMAAPQAAGAAALLASKWPFLVAQGTIPKILEVTAQDMGAAGADATYGDGFLRADLAMQPVGTLNVPVSGKMVAASGAQIVAGGALGSAGGVSSALKNAVAYDSYMRGFAIYMPSLVTTKSSASGTSAATAHVSGLTAASARSFVDMGDGRSLAFSGAPLMSGTSTGGLANALTSDSGQAMNADWSLAMTTGDSYLGVGQGSAAPLLLNDARWGQDSAFSNTDAGAGGALMGLVTDGTFSFMGYDLGKASRFSAGFARSSADIFSGANNSTTSSAAFMGYTYAVNDGWKVSGTASFLDEGNQLLGAQSSGFLNLASAATSVSYNLGTSLDLGRGYSLGFDASYAVTSPRQAQDSFVSNMSQLQSYSASLSFAKKDVAINNDSLGIQLSKPLHVFAGGADMTVPVDTDNNGNPILQKTRVSLVPDGSETDLNLVYARPFGQAVSGSFLLSGRQDADNVKGDKDVAGMFRLKVRFD